MKRKLSDDSNNSEPSPSKKLIKTNGRNDDNICQLPSEIHSEILNYLDDTLDGANFILTCRELYNSLYQNHSLFLSSRLKRDLGRLVQRVDLSTFVRTSNLAKKKSDEKEDEEDDADEEDEEDEGSDDEEEERTVRKGQDKKTLNSYEEKLIQTVSELSNTVELVKAKLKSKTKTLEKMAAWNSYLDDVERTHGKAIAKQLEDNIFRKCTIISFKSTRMDYRYSYEAQIKICDITIDHDAYDEEGCVTSWTLTVTKEPKKRGTVFVELPDGGDLILTKASEKVREYLGLGENISDKLFVDSIIMALPWNPEWNCVFYPNIKRSKY